MFFLQVYSVSSALFTLCFYVFNFIFFLLSTHQPPTRSRPPHHIRTHCKFKNNANTHRQRTHLHHHQPPPQINQSPIERITFCACRGHETNDRIGSKRISNAMHDITSSAGSNSNSNNSVSYRQSLGPGGTVQASFSSSGGGTPRRSWSSYAFNNKNFPDGKLSYESTQNQQQHPQQNQSSGSSASSSLYSVYSSNASSSNSSGKQSAANAGNTGGTGSGKLSSSLAARSRFERSSQDVMARASQIVM